MVWRSLLCILSRLFSQFLLSTCDLLQFSFAEIFFTVRRGKEILLEAQFRTWVSKICSLARRSPLWTLWLFFFLSCIMVWCLLWTVIVYYVVINIFPFISIGIVLVILNLVTLGLFTRTIIYVVSVKLVWVKVAHLLFCQHHYERCITTFLSKPNQSFSWNLM